MKKVPYTKLAFTLFRKCNASCSMCCFDSNPNCSEKLRIERIKQYIDEAKGIEYITTISFTGGEPFLEYYELLDLVKYASSSGKRVTTITNGFWATSYEFAYSRLKELQDAGLKHISVSHDSYHKEYIKSEYVANLLKAASQIGLPSTMACVKIKGEKIEDILDGLDNSLYATDLEIVPCLPAGGAKTTFNDCDYDRTLRTDTEGLRCIYGGNLVVAYDGNIYPCCSQMVFETGLSIGNFEELSLHEVLKKVKNNALLYLLRNKELKIFTDYAKIELNMEIPEKIVNPCELCALLFSKINTPRFKEFVNIEINKLLNKYEAK